jgi:hypothetical protein
MYQHHLEKIYDGTKADACVSVLDADKVLRLPTSGFSSERT